MNYGSELINISPKIINNNTNDIYIIYHLNNTLPIYNFTLLVNSNSVMFKNNSVNIAHIKEYHGVYRNFSGKIIKNMDKYNITISVRYILNNSLVSYIKYYHIKYSNFSVKKLNHYNSNSNLSNYYVNKYQSNKSNITKSIINDTFNHRNVISSENNNGNKKKLKNNSKPTNYSLSTNKSLNKKENQFDYIIYAIVGLIFGIIIAIMVLYVYGL